MGRAGHAHVVRQIYQQDICNPRPCGPSLTLTLNKTNWKSYQEAVARTKIVLKLLETKAATTLSLPPHNGGGGNASGGFPSATSNGNASSEAKRCFVGARNSSANARRDRRRPTSASAVVTNSTPLPKKKQDGTGNCAAANYGKNVKRNMKQVLRTSTEAYSDRVGHHGGGAARLHRNNNSRAGGAAAGGGASGGITAGGGGERGRMFAAAQTVQVAFRQRMFHRFVWAQAYLRSPTHAFGLFKRCLTVLRGVGAAQAAPSGAAPAGALATRQAEAPMDVNSIDAWPELPGFSLSLPHHVHAANPIFLRYVRWCRLESSNSSFGEGVRGAPATLPVAAAAVESPQLLTSAQEPPRLRQQQQPPEGAQLFEKKHAIRTAAVRSMLVDLRVPFLPGALDSAMEDLERIIAREGAGDGGSDRDVTGAATRSKPPANGVGKAGGGKLGQHTAEISFAGWYGWWIRHLPFDPASTGCLLKTVRCAKALHGAEISAAAGKL